MNKPLFIVIEGIDGSGKSTASQEVARILGAYWTFEPTTGPYGKDAREHGAAGRAAQARKNFLQDRKEHAESVLTPTLASGRSVVCDRHWASTVVYQTTSPEDEAGLVQEHRDGLFGPWPDLTLILHVPFKVALERMTSRGRPLEGDLELETKLLMRIDRYKALATRFSDAGVILVDATRSPDEVVDGILAVLHPYL